MAGAKPITIVGGGLAGLTLGIGLRQRGVAVTIHETGHYPRHRVCGEFISGRGLHTLESLGLLDLLAGAGAVPAQTAAFFSPTRSAPPRALPSAAVCLSRFALDEALVKKFRELGGRLTEGKRVEVDFGEGIVRATGRRAQPARNGPRWLGLKIHARNIPLVADLEMHVSPQGYVGLCGINGGEVNVCGLFRVRADHNSEMKNWREQLRGPPGSPLRQRLANAEFAEDSFCAVAALSIRPQKAANLPGICIGDALTMIPPFTGNGMSMAFEAAELAVAPLEAWSFGALSWQDARHNIARECDGIFSRRLAWAKWLQRILLVPALQNPLVALAFRSGWLWRLMFDRTRQTGAMQLDKRIASPLITACREEGCV